MTLLPMFAMFFLLLSPVHGKLGGVFLHEEPLASEEEIKNFRNARNLKKGAKVKVHKQKKDGTFQVGSTKFLLEDCKPSNAMKNTKVNIDGTRTTIGGLSDFCMIKDDKSTLIVDRKGTEINEILAFEKQTGKSKTVVPLKKDVLGEYDNADLDPEIYKDVWFDPPDWEGHERHLQNDAVANNPVNDFPRRLSFAECESVKVIRTALGVDVTFSDYYVSLGNRLAGIVEGANVYYQQFCKTMFVNEVVISNMWNVINRPTLCNSGTDAVLYQFRFNSPMSGKPGTSTGQAHLFFGQGGYGCDGGCGLGCARLDGTCNTNDGYGVNYMMHELDFGAEPTLYKQSLLFAHEAGHVLGAEHDFGGWKREGYVMWPNLGNLDVTAFSTSSIDQINDHINPITNPICVETASTTDLTCTEGAEDWDPDCSGSCSTVCVPTSGSCGTGFTGCGQACDATCGSNQYCNNNQCASCSDSCTLPYGECGTGQDSCDQTCSVGCTGNNEVCNNGQCKMDPCRSNSKRKDCPTDGPCRWSQGQCVSV